MNSKKIVYSAVSAGLSAVIIILCAFLPTKFVPLVFAAAAYYFALDKCGAWGILSIVASLVISFFAGGGFQTSFALTVILFAPYSVLAYLLRKIPYTTTRNWVIRGVIMEIFFIISAILVLVLVEFITGVSLELVIEKVGKWAIVALFTLFALPTDFFFTFAMQKIGKAIGKDKK